ncbi:MAG TPA: hypothetical protein VG028_09600 [Terriglobia bacterium]|nr:hypothetical protein [Terriglobia bacterium]
MGSRFRGNACIGGRPRLANGSSTHFRHAAFLGLLLNFIFLPHFLFAKKQTKENVHITIIRELGSEIAVAKVPLPRGKRGIFLNAKGEVNQADADSEMKLNGPAIRAGMPVEITKITFKSGKIVFEINGGGKSREKWYQHIEIGVGGSTQPISQQPPVLTYGSWITLNLPGKMTEVTADQVKKLLDHVLDFNRQSPTVLYSPTVPPKFKEAIKKHQVVVGMDRDAVLSAKGPPDRKVREVRDGVEQVDWIYGLPPHALFVTFDGDTVVSVKQY